MNQSVNDSQWWNRFWKQGRDQATVQNTGQLNWANTCWKVQIELWDDLYGKFRPGFRMLECGCGSARISRHFARKGLECTMLDYSPEALDVARTSFGHERLKGNFVQGDICSLPFPTGSFDFVFSGGVLEFFDDISAPIAEMSRVLRPGGLFIAHMVPRKISIQSLANLERRLAHGIRNIVRCQWRSVFRPIQFVPDGYRVNSARLNDYVMACKGAGLHNPVGLTTLPFPSLSLPRSGEVLYARCMQALVPWWRRFNSSPQRWTNWWGMTYVVYGTKGKE